MKRILIVLLILVTSAFAAGQHSVTIKWVAPVGGVSATGYNIKRSATPGGPYATVGAVGIQLPLQYIDTSQAVQQEGVKFYYVITATAPGGESDPSSEVNAIIPFSRPTPPTGVTATSQ